MFDATKKFIDLIEYVLRHAPMLRNHKEFGEIIRDVRYEISNLEAGYKRIVLASQGHCMASEMDGPEEIAVLVYGLHDKIINLEKEIWELKSGVFEKVNDGTCPYCHGKKTEKLNGILVRCRFCGGGK